MRIATTCAQFEHLHGECLKLETAWRSELDSNSLATKVFIDAKKIPFLYYHGLHELTGGEGRIRSEDTLELR
jgi:hypothetical protein